MQILKSRAQELTNDVSCKKINNIAGIEEEHGRLAKPQNAVRTKQSVSKDPDSGVDLEPDLKLEREFDAVRKRRHLEQQ